MGRCKMQRPFYSQNRFTVIELLRFGLIQRLHSYFHKLPSSLMADSDISTEATKPSFNRRKSILFGKDSDSIIKTFFGSNALVAIVVLALITIFLFKEGAGFVGLYHKSLQDYRLSGLEYVDILKEKREDYTELTRYLNDMRAQWINQLKDEGLSQSEISSIIMTPAAKDLFFGYMRVGSDLKRFVKEKMDAAIEIRDQNITNKNLQETIDNYADQIATVSKSNFRLRDEQRPSFALRIKQYSTSNQLSLEEANQFAARAAAIEKGENPTQADRDLYIKILEEEAVDTERSIKPVDFTKEIESVTNEQERYAEILTNLESGIHDVLAKADAVEFNSPELNKRIQRFKELNTLFLNNFDKHLAKLEAWDQSESISVMQAIGSFITGKQWVTASDQQDWYGLLPLLTGSLLISGIALLFAIPFGVGAAIYVNQIAGPAERNLIKPYVEFISAIPSVVIGFFGVVVFGELIRLLSQQDFMQWVPFFPIQERLNAFTAGCLLALMAIPTIFTLAEDAINNIPRHFREASLAIGATPLQTTLRVIVPTALSGIISAVMLGFGRVIGETMVVLLCAGNRIKIPDFTHGAGVIFEPVHTMTGIIAQEMGEVVQGSLHYRALFMVGIVLFFLSLIINYSAQLVVRKFSKLGD